MANCSNTTTKRFGIRWTIENISKIQGDSIVIGPDFYLIPECMFRVSFKKGGSYLYVFLCNKSVTEIKIKRTLALFDHDNKKVYETNDEQIFSLKTDCVKDISGYAKRKDVEKLTNDVLIIDLCVSIMEVATNKLNRSICDIDPEKKLREDLRMMLENPVNSDVSLQVGDERISAHWSILCTRSPYFKRMFYSGMRESVQNSITFTDLSLDTLKKLIQFLYTADFVEKDDLKELFDLYYASDKYEVMDLRTLCGRKIILNATTDNAGEILQLFHRHNDKALKMEVMDFIYSHSDAVFQTEGWKKFEASEPSIAEVVIFFCSKKK